jgi:glycosyltransferase involved in cell wall biosynthesis
MTENDLTFCVCTFNSSSTLKACLESIRSSSRDAQLLVVDHHSTDDTIEIAKKFGARIVLENQGLGHARQLCFDNADTEFLVFVDSDVEILQSNFFSQAKKHLEDPAIGAIVGLAHGHRIAYGLPASLLVLRKKDFLGRVIPHYIDARETFFIQKRLDQLKLKTIYVFEAMRHRSQYRRYKPEWEGANTRMLPASMLKELGFTLRVILFVALNSGSKRNMAYLPIFYAKFFRGFVNPGPWIRLRRDE